MNSIVNAWREMDLRKRLVCEGRLGRFKSEVLDEVVFGIISFKN